MEPDPPPHSIECSHPPANICLGQQFGINVVQHMDNIKNTFHAHAQVMARTHSLSTIT